MTRIPLEQRIHVELPPEIPRTTWRRVRWATQMQGTTFEGRFQGFSPSKQQPVAYLVTDQAHLALQVTRLLRGKLELARVGALVGIEFRGPVPSARATGSRAFSFDVYVGDKRDRLAKPVDPAATVRRLSHERDPDSLRQAGGAGVSDRYKLWQRRKQLVEDIRAQAKQLAQALGDDHHDRVQNLLALAADEEMKTANLYDCNRFV